MRSTDRRPRGSSCGRRSTCRARRPGRGRGDATVRGEVDRAVRADHGPTGSWRPRDGVASGWCRARRSQLAEAPECRASCNPEGHGVHVATPAEACGNTNGGATGAAGAAPQAARSNAPAARARRLGNISRPRSYPLHGHLGHYEPLTGTVLNGQEQALEVFLARPARTRAHGDARVEPARVLAPLEQLGVDAQRAPSPPRTASRGSVSRKRSNALRSLTLALPARPGSPRRRAARSLRRASKRVL